MASAAVHDGDGDAAHPTGSGLRLAALQDAIGALPGVHRVQHLASTAYNATLAAPIENARELAMAQAARARDAAAAQVQRAEAALRQRFGGYDTSRSKQHMRERALLRYRALFDLLDTRARGSVPIDELEDLFGAAGLYEARTEVGQLAYDADTDGNGALDFTEFTTVMDALCAYTKESVLLSRAPRLEGSFVFGTEGASLSFKQVIFRTFDDPSFSELSRIVSIVIVAVIFLAVFVFVLESEPALDALSPLFQLAEGVCAVIFTLEYAIRVGTCPSLRAFLLSPSNMLDLLTIVPYFLDTIDEAFHPKGGFGGAMRILRIFRVFRIFRVTKYVPYVNVMASAAKGAAAPLGMAVLVLGIGVLLLAFATFYAERGSWDAARRKWVNDAGDTSPYQDVGTSVYWTIITLSTVGYGDISPVTGGGKAVGAITALAGCLILSFPVAIYTDEFALQYGEYEKQRALQAELGGADLIVTLTRARARTLAGRNWPRSPVERSLKSHRASAAQPRNIAMMRWAVNSSSSNGSGAVPVPLQSARGGPPAHRSHAVNEMTTKATAGRTLPPVQEVDGDASFAEVWQTSRRSSGADAPTQTVVAALDAHAAAVAAEQAVLARRLMQRMTGAVAEGAMSPPAPLVAAAPAMTSISPAPVRMPTAQPARPQSAAAQLPETPALSEYEYNALVEQAREALRARRSAAAAAAGVAASDMDPWADTALTARSFLMEDFTRDADVEAAILELLSDVRKRLWAEIRLLEAKFRDDIAIELSRRWSRWMAMPPSRVVHIASPFVFRRDELHAAMRFDRAELPIGIVEHSQSATTSATSTAPAAPFTSSGGFLASVSSSILSDVRDVLAGHAPVHAKAGAAALASQVRTVMPLVLQPAPDLAHNYRARIAARYTDLLGDEVSLELAPTPPSARNEQDADAGVAGKMLLPVRRARTRAVQLPPLLSRSTSGGDDGHTAASSSTAVAYSSTGTDDGVTARAQQEASSEWVQTAFGMSQLPRNLQTISSSIGSGTASISGAGATIPRAIAPGAASTALRQGPLSTMLSTLSAAAAAPLPMQLAQTKMSKCSAMRFWRRRQTQ